MNHRTALLPGLDGAASPPDVPISGANRLSGAVEGTLPAALLERIIGRPPAHWTEDDLVDLVRERGIRIVSLMHVGTDGWLRTLDFVPRSLGHLHDVLSGGERADGSSLFSGLGIKAGASDIVLRPRIGNAFIDPFSPLPTLVLLCGHAARDGRPLPESPDTILRLAAERLRAETGADLDCHGEVEYFLGKRSEETDMYGVSERGYHAASPFVFGEELRRHALAILAEIGVRVKYGHSEVGYVEPAEAEGVIWEQHEIELALAPLPEAAEAVVLTHWVLRNLAHRRRLRCSFDPILRRGHAGNGLHFHFSPLVDGAHVGGRGPDGRMQPPAQWLIAGLVQLGAALMAFGNRSESSFVRLTQAREAPNTIVWGDYDRSALIRLPIVATTEEGRGVSPATIEFRLPDGSAQPYLLLAGVAQAMIHGRATKDIEALLERTSAAAAKAKARAATSVPRNAAEVADALARARKIFEDGDVFPPSLIEQVVERLKR